MLEQVVVGGYLSSGAKSVLEPQFIHNCRHKFFDFLL